MHIVSNARCFKCKKALNIVYLQDSGNTGKECINRAQCMARIKAQQKGRIS